LKFSPQQKIRFEIVLSLLASIPNSIDLDVLIKEIDNIKSQNFTKADSVKYQPQSSSKTQVISQTNLPENKQKIQEIGIEKQITQTQKKQNTDILKAQLEAQWNLFIDKYATEGNNLTSLLSAKFTFEDNKVNLIADSPIIFDNFQSPLRKGKIEKFLKEYFGDNIKFEIIANYSITETSEKNKTKTINTSNENIDANSEIKQSKKNNNLSELESAIVEIFNAKENN
jgi:hypothetical protein